MNYKGITARGEVTIVVKGIIYCSPSQRDLLGLNVDLQITCMLSSAGIVTVAGVAFATFTV